MKEPVPTCRAGDHQPPQRSPSGHSPASIERAAGLFRAMGDPARLRTLELLSRGELCVTEIVAATAEKFSTVSQRLRLLRSEGLIVRRRQGTHVFYDLADRHVADLVLNALAHAAELQSSPAISEEGD